MPDYRLTLQHDSGTVTLQVTAADPVAAINLVCESEKAPHRAVLAIVPIAHPEPQIVLQVQGGLILSVLSDTPLTCTVLDYDIDGADPDRVVTVPNGDCPEDAYVTIHAAGVMPDRVKELLEVASHAGEEQCNTCGAWVQPGDDHFSTEDGTYCNDCYAKANYTTTPK